MRRIVFVSVALVAVTALIVASGASPSVFRPSYSSLMSIRGNTVPIPSAVHIMLNLKDPEIGPIPNYLLNVNKFTEQEALDIAKAYGVQDVHVRDSLVVYEGKVGKIRVWVAQFGPNVWVTDKRYPAADVKEYKDEAFYISRAQEYIKPLMQKIGWLSGYELKYKVKFGRVHLMDMKTGESAEAGVSVYIYAYKDGYMMWPGIEVGLTNGGRLMSLKFSVWDVKKEGELQPMDIKDAISLMRTTRLPFVSGNSDYETYKAMKLQYVVINKVEIVYFVYFTPRDIKNYEGITAMPFYRLQGYAVTVDGEHVDWDVLVPALQSV